MREATHLDLASWKAAAESQLKQLIPRVTHVNVLVRADPSVKSDNGKDVLIENITRELQDANGRGASPSLNVLHHTLLQSIWTHELGDNGLLVLASDADESGAIAWASETAQFGPLAAQLLSLQVVHLCARQRSIVEVDALRQSLADAESSFAAEQVQRAIMDRHAANASILLRVSRLVDGIEEVESIDELMSKILNAITSDGAIHKDQADAAKRNLYAGLVVVADHDEECAVWSSSKDAGRRLTWPELRWMAADPSANRSFRAPLATPQHELVRLLWPQEEITDSCRLAFIKVPRDEVTLSDQAQYLLLFEPDAVPEGLLVEDAFIAELALAVRRVIKWNKQKRRQREIHTQLMETADDRERTKNELKTVGKRHDRWTELWQCVLGRLWTKLNASEGTQLDGTREELTTVIRCHVQEAIGGCCEISTLLEVRMVTGHGAVGDLIQGILSVWLRPHELAQMLSQPRHPHISSKAHATVEICGSLQDQVLAVCRTMACYDNETSSVGIVAVRISESVQDPTSESDRIQAAIERILVEAVEVTVAVDKILELYDRTSKGASETFKLTELLEKEKYLVANATDQTRRHVSFTSVLASLSDRFRVDNASWTEALHGLPEYKLWIRDQDETAMNTLQRDGSKQIRNYDPTVWKPSPHCIEISVNGTCHGMVETTEGTNSEELKLVASVIQSAFSRRELEQQLEDLHAEMRRNANEATEKAQRDDARRRALVCHWHAVANLLQASFEEQDPNEDRAAVWTETLANVTRAIQQAVPEVVSSVRIVFLTVDIERHCVVETNSESVSTDHSRLAALLDLWNVSGDDETPRTMIVSSQDDTSQQVIRTFFSAAPVVTSDFVLVAVRTHRAMASTKMIQSFAILVGLTLSPTAASLSEDVHHALEMNLKLVATAYERWRIHKATQQRATQAETALVTTTDQLTETQQWVAFMDTTQSAAKQLIYSAMDRANEQADSTWVTQAAAFVQTACGCDAVEFYQVEETTRQLIALSQRDESLSSSTQSLDALLATSSSSSTATLSVETTPSGRRLVMPFYNHTTDCVMDILVVQWRHDSTVPSLEVMESIVRPWLALAFSLVRDRETQRIAHATMKRQIASLSQEKHELETQGLQLQSQLTQTEQRRAALQNTVQLTNELLQQVEMHVASVANVDNSTDLWTALAKYVASNHNIHGVQLYEGTEPSMVLSTLSSLEDASLRKAMESGAGLVRRCLTAHEPQENRVAFSSDCKRVRVVSLSNRDHPCCLLLVLTSDSHQQLKQVIHWVDLCVAITSSRVAELEHRELHTVASRALESALEEVTMQLQGKSESLAHVERRLSWSQSLFKNLTRDLVSHDLWRGVEKTVHASSGSMATAKLTTMWKFLQDTATQRLQDVAVGLTVQLYGVVASTKGEAFVFSLPTSSRDGPASKGFFCVALRQLEQRREWRKMAQCIRSGKRLPQRGSWGNGIRLLFPVRRFGESTGRIQKDSLDDSEEDGAEEEEGGEEKGDVVGVLLVKIKEPVPQFSGEDGVELAQLVQELVDAMAPRIDWIGRVVDKKQQSSRQPSKGGVQPREACEEIDAQAQSDRLETPMQSTDSRVAVKAHTPVVSRSHSNQDEHADDREDDDVSMDSDEERHAERMRERRYVAVTSGVLEFVLRVQSLSSDGEKDSSASLRLLVARELKNVWTTHSDGRKHHLDSCELFFSVNGQVADSLDFSRIETTTTAPSWVVNFLVHRASAITSGVRLWKLDVSRWIASLALDSIVVLVALTGSSALSRAFDDDDERVHLPSLIRAIGFQTTRIAQTLACRARQQQQKCIEDEAAAQRDAEWKKRLDASLRRSQREAELSDVALRLLLQTDERVLIQLALDAMQRFLNCSHVAYHAAATKNVLFSGQQPSDTNTVAMETVLRVRVVTSDENELLGTMVARLTDHERKAMETGEEGKEWTIRLLQRVADATAVGIVSLRQRVMLCQAETTLKEASNGMETHQHELVALQNENESLRYELDEFTKETARMQTVDQENASLHQQLQQLHEQKKASVDAQEDMAWQLQQYESQLVEVNAQLEKSIEAETQLLRLEEIHAVTLAREARVEKKRLKQKLQLQQLMVERSVRREKDEHDQAELAELRRQVVVLTEKQQQKTSTGGMDASSVATAVLQAQAQAMAQTQAYHHQQQSHAEWKQQQQQQQQQTHEARVHKAAVQRRMVRQWQVQQQQLQKRKQLDLAKELRQLAAMEVQEMTRRSTHTSSVSPRKTSRRVATWREEASDGYTKVHDLRSRVPTSLPSETVAKVSAGSKPAATAVSRLQPPRIAVAERRASNTTRQRHITEI